MSNLFQSMLLGSFLLLGLIAPCIGQTNNASKVQLNAQRLDAQYAEVLKYALAESKYCGEQIANTSHAQLVSEEVIYRNDSSSNKLDLMASKKKLTPKQIDALKLFVNDSLKCRAQLRDSLASVPYFSEIPNFLSTNYDLIYSSLIAKDMTIGEANRAKAQLLQEVQVKLQTASRSLSQDLKNDAEREMAVLIRQQSIDAAKAREDELDRQQLIKNIGQSLQMMVVPPAAFYKPPQSLNCTSTKTFGTVNTNCY